MRPPAPATNLRLVILLLLGCAAAPGTAGQSAPAAADAPPGPDEGLRFGDPLPLAYDEPFFPGAIYDASIPTPDSILGQGVGTRLARHAEILACFRAWAASSDRVRVQTFGRTHEGREMIWVAIASPANVARLDEIRADLARLADARDIDEAQAERLIAGTPAVAWMGYSIHGDETSGCDAALALGYHLAASQDAEVAELLEQVVVVLEPCMNPDGRERILGMVEQSAGRTPNLDHASLHRGRWPWGRGNHYLFDMNRDWMAGTQPETRARWQAARSFHPQLLVDAHEMGSHDTFLFYPQAKPHNPHLPASLDAWHRRYAAGAAEAFDRRGWAYYTREWADAWGPFYSDAWGSLNGAVGILYEQAGTAGFPLRRASGKLLTYREAVHHQVVASQANLSTLATNREQALRDFAATARANVAADTPGNERAFVAVPRGNRRRERELLRTLLGQGIEVQRADEAFEASGCRGAEGASEERRRFPAGTWIVPARQPARPLVRAYLDFDPRYDREALQEEREELERKGESKIYDVTSWNLAHALDLDAWWVDAPQVASTPVVAVPENAVAPAAAAEASEPAPVAWLVDAIDDDALAFAARAMEAGLAVHWADEPVRAAGRELARGSLMVRRSENEGTPQEIATRVAAAAAFAGVLPLPVTTGLATDVQSADLGGQHFHLLARPRVALLANSPIAPDGYGHLWHHLDQRVGVPFSILDAQSLDRFDLRRFNVLVLPDSWGSEGIESVLEPRLDELRAWVEGGGTLIACGDSAAALTKGELGLSGVALRRHALDELEAYREAAGRERAARDVVVDEAAVWDGPAAEGQIGDEEEGAGAEERAEEEGEQAEPEQVDEDDDLRARLFSPQGVTLRAAVNQDSWISSGCDEVLPVLVAGDHAFLAREPITTAVRLDPAPTLRLSGLLWPEARERLADSAWLTVESHGHGQIVLFAAPPGFRGYHLASARLFANAVVLGPGLGAETPLGW